MDPIAISILMANYNNAIYIQEAIESVLKQTSSNWELVICDDASEDSSVDIIEPYLQHYQVSLIQNPQNLGYIKTLKNLINAARYDIVAILDSDDALALHAIERVIEEYKSHPEAGFIFSNFAYCNQQLKVTRTGYSTTIPSGKTNLHCDQISHIKTFRKSAYEQTRGYDEAILYAEDKDLSYKMEEVCTVLFINDVLYYYRVLDFSQSHGQVNFTLGITSHIRAITKAYNRRATSGFLNLSESELLKKIRFLRGRQNRKKAPDRPKGRTDESQFLLRLFQKIPLHIHIRTAYQFLRNRHGHQSADHHQASPDPGGFIVCHDMKFMFVAIPKNRVTHLKHIVLQHDYDLDIRSNHEVLHDILGYMFDGYTRISLKDAQMSCYRDYLKIAVYRDPVDRFLSLYTNKVAQGHPSSNFNYYKAQGVDGVSLKRFLKFAKNELKKPSLLQDEHIRPQSLYYQPKDVDFIVALEDLDYFLTSKFNIQSSPKLNQSMASKTSLSIRDRKSIMHMYKDDFLLKPEPYTLT
jgi:glycosyltransferase involved in cell wall biosynthesis